MTMTITALETTRVMVDGQEPIMPQLPVDTIKKCNNLTNIGNNLSLIHI